MRLTHIDWRTVRHTLRTMPPPASVRGADAFWRDFHARRAMYPQRSQTVRVRFFQLFFLPALAAAAAVIVLIGGMLAARMTAMHGGGMGRPGFADGYYASAMVLTDEPAQVTIPGISGMEPGDDPGDG